MRSILQWWFRNQESSFAAKIRGRLFKTYAYIDTGVFIKNIQGFFADDTAALYHGCYILNPQGQFTIGKHSHLGANCFVNVVKGSVTIGDHVAVGPSTQIIAYSNHYEPGKLVSDIRTQADITIGNNVFIGANSVVLPGTVIEDHVVVGANSLVKGTLRTKNIYAGSPLRLIKENWYEEKS